MGGVSISVEDSGIQKETTSQVHTSVRINLHSIVCLNVKELLAWRRRHIWSLGDSKIYWPVWLNGLVFVNELNGCGFESCCCHLNFRYDACFQQGIAWYSGKL